MTMQFKNFTITSEPVIENPICNCGGDLETINQGLSAPYLFCSECEKVYKIGIIDYTVIMTEGNIKSFKEYLKNRKR